MPWRVAFVAGLTVLAITVWALAVGGVTEDYVGARRCQECHHSAFEAWAASTHARAQVALDEKQRVDPRCTQCHGESEGRVAGVQCESCHGGGQVYARRYVMKDRELSRIVGLVDPDQDTCRRCHTSTSPAIRPFEYNASLQIVRHGQDPKPQPVPK